MNGLLGTTSTSSPATGITLPRFELRPMSSVVRRPVAVVRQEPVEPIAIRATPHVAAARTAQPTASVLRPAHPSAFPRPQIQRS